MQLPVLLPLPCSGFNIISHVAMDQGESGIRGQDLYDAVPPEP